MSEAKTEYTQRNSHNIIAGILKTKDKTKDKILKAARQK